MSPLLKKNDPMDKTNNRSVSILPVTSKNYEKILSEQLSAYLEHIFNKYLFVCFQEGTWLPDFFVETGRRL